MSPWIINSLLDLDAYKLTMLQYIWGYYPDVYTRFEFINRHKHLPLGEEIDIDTLQTQINHVTGLRFRDSELEFLSGLKRSDGSPLFYFPFLDALANLRLVAPQVRVNSNGQLVITPTGLWFEVTLWETLLLSLVNELHSQYLTNNPNDVWRNGTYLLGNKIHTLQANPQIRFADFGTRRRFSGDWQEFVLRRLKDSLPSTQFLGTSNLYFAHKLSLPWVGTQAHELFMVEAALCDENPVALFNSPANVLRLWENLYGKNLLTALTDTFGTDSFFKVFLPFATRWNTRQDSGDPITYGENLLAYYAANNIDPLSHTVIFSDGLDLPTMIQIINHFSGRLRCLFGWGTNLTNDVGLPVISIVVKVAAVSHDGINWIPTVKLSDNPSKAMGPADKVAYYRQVFSSPEGTAAPVIY